jgi:hypothetical protein
MSNNRDHKKEANGNHRMEKMMKFKTNFWRRKQNLSVDLNTFRADI